MKKIAFAAVAVLLVMTLAFAQAEGEIKMGQADYAAHGTKCFAVLTVAMQDDVIVGAYIDEFQFMSAETAVGVPNSDADFGTNYPEGYVLASKKANAETYSANMAKSDFMKSAIADEAHLALFVKDYIDDLDGYEGMPFTRFYADCIGKGMPIDWEMIL